MAGGDYDDTMGSSSSAVEIPMDSTWEYVHGRIDPGLEESMNLVESVAAREPKRLNEQEKKVLTEMGNGDSSKIVTSTDVSLGTLLLL